VNLPVTTRSGRQIKVSKQAQAAALAESEKQTKALQRKKEQAKKEQDLTISRHGTYESVSQVIQKNTTTLNPSAAGVVVCTPSASVYHTPNNGILRKMEANIVTCTGTKCHACGRVMPPRMPMTPTNSRSASQSTVNSKISTGWNSERAITDPAVSSNLRLAPVTVRHPPSTVPWPTGLPPSKFQSSARYTAEYVNTTATLSGVTAGTQDSAQAQAASVRGRRLYLRAKGTRENGDGQGHGQGRDSGSLAPLTIVIPACPRPVAPVLPPSASMAAISPSNKRCDPSGRSAGGSGSTSTHTANLIQTTAASTEARIPTESVRPGPMNTTGGANHGVAVAAFAHAYYSQYNSNQTTTSGSDANAAVNNTAYIYTCTSGPSGTFILGATGPTGAYYPYYYPFTTDASAKIATNAAAGPSHGRAIDFPDPEIRVTHTRSVGDLPGSTAQVPDGVAKPTVAANDNRLRTTVVSSSQVKARQTKRRKLDSGE